MYITSENIREYKAEIFKKRNRDVNKGSFGKATIFGSSRDFVGAVKLSALGELSMRMGTGYSILAVPEEIVGAIYPNVFECILSPQKSQNGAFVFNETRVKKAISNASSVAVGMGMTKSYEVQKLVCFLFENFKGSLLLDADAINSIDLEILAKPRKCQLLITPHLKEFSALSKLAIEKIKSEKEEIAVSFAREYNLTLLLKDFETVITNGDKTHVVKSGSPSLAKAGSGDFLSGSIAGISANFPLFESAVTATEIIGHASSDFSKEYNDNIMLTRDLFFMVKNYLQND